MKSVNSFIAAILFLSLPAFAAQSVCEVHLSGSKDQVLHETFAAWEKDYADGLGMRGYMGDLFPNTPEVAEIAEQYGLTWWGIRFFLVPTLEEAQAHRAAMHEYQAARGAQETDLIAQPLYILGTDAELGVKFKRSGPEKTRVPISPAKVNELWSRGAYEIFPDGRVEEISSEHLQRRLSSTGLGYNKTDDIPSSKGRNSLSASGWVAFKLHGIHDYDQWKNSSDAKKIMKEAQKLFDRGYTVRFNHDYKAALNALRNQKRTYRDGEERKEFRSELNRFHDQETYDTALARLMEGQGYSVELYNERGKLVAGEIGYRRGNHFVGDSIFYDDIKLGKVEALLLFEMLYERGIAYSDPEMVTSYTKSMGGYLIPFPEFREKIKSGPAEPVVLPEAFEIRGKEYLNAAFDALSRRGNQGWTRKSFISRTPVLTGAVGDDAVQAAAAKYGVVRDQLNLEIVESLEEAKVHAAGLSDPGELPLYLVRAESAALDVSSFRKAEAFVQAALDKASSDYSLVMIMHPRFTDDLRTLDKEKFLKFLDLDLQAEPLKWSGSNQRRRITVKAWSVPPSAKR